MANQSSKVNRSDRTKATTKINAYPARSKSASARVIKQIDKRKQATDTAKINAAIDDLKELASAKDSLEIVSILRDKHAGQPWLNVEIVHYSFAEEIYNNRRWRDWKDPTNVKVLPPGTTFLGVVLDKTLEVSIVETIGSDYK